MNRKTDIFNRLIKARELVPCVMIVHLPLIVSISRDDCALAFHCQYIT